MIVAGFVKVFGTGWLNKLLPPALVGAVVIVIGLGLSATAVKMALLPMADPTQPVNLIGLMVAFITLASAVAFSSYFKGFLKTIPILMGIIVGYVVSMALGLVSFEGIANAAWIGLPHVTYPKFDITAIAIIAPVAIVVIV